MEFLQSLYLGKLLEYFSQNQKLTAREAYIYGLAVVLSILIRVLSFQFHYLETYSTGLKVRTSCSSLIYRKILSRSRWTRNNGYFFTFSIAVGRGQKVTRERDNRIRIMNDIIFRMREIKTYAWETPYAELINKIRRCELTHVKKLNHISNENITIVTYIHKIAVYVFILVLTTTGTPLEPHLIFMSINIYNLLKTSVHHATFAVNLISEVKVCITRIEIFLLSDHEAAIGKQKTEEMQGCKIYARNLTAQWNSSKRATIKDVNFKLDCGQLVAVTGDTGSGKSSLFQTILQELLIVDGILSQDGLISYASQNPWVFSATIQENIIFNETFNKNKYLNVLNICALKYDISLFSHGDKTLVGERGAMLSGGQKARINLARAIYKDADIYLLDNPLAAMDVCVAQQIFTQCILQYLKTKSVVLITDNLKFLNYSDRVYVLKDGTVKFSGRYKTLEEAPNNIPENSNKTLTKPSEKHYKAQIETREHRGSDEVNTYTTYLFANGSKFFVYLQCFLFILSQVFMNGSDVFLSFWINLRQNPTKFSITLLQYFSDVKCLYIYSGFILIMVFLFHMGSLNFVECCNKYSVKLHDTLFNKILYGTMKFFDNHPSGRIVNRISSDMGTIDETIPKYMYQAARQICTVLGKSPIYTHVVATIDGLTTIRVSEAQKYSFLGDMVGNVGLSITESLLMISAIQYMVKIYGELETQMTSVERVAEYDDLTVEDNNKSEINPPAAWPAEGQILFQSVSMRYSPEKPSVLRNIYLEFQAGEKIGIVGRTGAGKSSLINALFHLYEFEGTILIDNVDIKTVPLGTLRSRIATVPQNPVLFSGTIRENLDPFKEFTDCQLWTALEEVNLKLIVSDLPSGLNNSLSEGGVNFSAGQKQLMCLVRAILKKCTIIVLDEATAFLDLNTEKLIQNTIQKRFHKATILRIAHRLDSVMHSDKILVLDNGCAVEFGTPNGLLQNVNDGKTLTKIIE
ncbi:multidrug resistance-associated protein 1-like [Zophobas morio]|uniref:multidrug resistance-associated protein 1-like n=1 Tax=Zophobas morio TaxID=2755281 RepID=UPI003082AB83